MICLFVYQTTQDVADNLISTARTLGEVRAATSQSFLLNTNLEFGELYGHFDNLLFSEGSENSLIISVVEIDKFDGFLPRETIEWIISRLRKNSYRLP